MISRHNRNAVLCRFDDIVSAARNQASPNERDIRQGVERGQFSDRVDEQDAACQMVPQPRASADAMGCSSVQSA